MSVRHDGGRRDDGGGDLAGARRLSGDASGGGENAHRGQVGHGEHTGAACMASGGVGHVAMRSRGVEGEACADDETVPHLDLVLRATSEDATSGSRERTRRRVRHTQVRRETVLCWWCVHSGPGGPAASVDFVESKVN